MARNEQPRKEKRTGKEKIFTLLITIMALAIATNAEEFWRLTPTEPGINTLSPIVILNRLCIGCRNTSHFAEINGTIKVNDTLFTPGLPIPSFAEGLVFYDDEEKALAVYNNEQDITLQIGQESWIRVRNNQGFTILDGQVVYINGAQGNTPTIALAKSDLPNTSRLIGVATHDIEDNSFGFITTHGIVHGLDTSNFSAGDMLWLSDTTTGKMDNIEPSPPSFTIHVATVMNSNPNNGSVLVDLGPTDVVGNITIQNLSINQVNGTNNALIFSKPNGNLQRTQNFNQFIEFPSVFNVFIEKNTRNLDENIYGVLQQELTGQLIDSATNITFSHGIGKVAFIVLAGTDLDGIMQVTCDTIDRITGTVTPSFEMNITISGISIDDSFTDGQGNTVHSFTDGYITPEWCFGEVNVSVQTGDLNISDMDIYATSFEQFNDVERIILDTFDFNAKATNTNAWIRSYLYHVQDGSNRVNITQIANWTLDPADITTNKYYRLRKGLLNFSINGTNSGIFQDMFFGRDTQQDWEDVTMKIWFRTLIPIE